MVPNAIPGLPDVNLTGMVGLGVVKRLPADGRYVVFSDHHMTDNGNRQNFFAVENKKLYLDILENYYAVGGFDLIENGDLEELLIYEPDLSEMGDIAKWSWSEIFSYRRSQIEKNIKLIAKDNSDYYRVVYENFASKKKYHKIVGNHDVSLMDGALMELLRDETGYAFDAPVETVILSDNERHHYFICHGHQFDHSCTHGFAEYVGESYTQAGAWAFQGPDRTWLYANDWLDEMLDGTRPVYNNITGTEPSGMTPLQVVNLVTAFASGSILLGAATGALAAGTLSVAALEAIFNIVPPQNFFEEVMQKNIAWEYFEDPNNYVTLVDQFGSGKRWFKFRHTEEIELTDFLANETLPYDGVSMQPQPWGNDVPPTVVIGHSHEARLKARRPNGKTASYYINTAAAGRFENMIWGLEIVDKTALLFTWHCDESGTPVRTTWEPFTVLSSCVLWPTSHAKLADLVKDLPKEVVAETAINETNFLIAAMHEM
jgi:hypothetical protein